MLVQLKCDAARRRHTTAPNETVTQVELYKISVGYVLSEGRGIPTLVHGNIRVAVIHLLASVEQLNALIETKGVLLNELQGHELIDALLKIRARSVALQRAIGQYGGNRRINSCSHCERSEAISMPETLRRRDCRSACRRLAMTVRGAGFMPGGSAKPVGTTLLLVERKPQRTRTPRARPPEFGEGGAADCSASPGFGGLASLRLICRS